MKKYTFILPLVFTTTLFSCSSVISESFKKDKIDFINYNKIAVLNIESNMEQLPSKEITEITSLKFLKKGFNVIQNKHLKIMVDQDTLRVTGFSENTKKKLQLQDINAVATGFLSGYKKNIPIINNTLPLANNASNLNECKVSLSFIMFDINSGETIWSARGLKVQQSDNLTIDMVLNDVLKEIDAKLPESFEAKKFLWIF